MAESTAYQKVDDINMSLEEDERDQLIKLHQSGVLKGFMKLSKSKFHVIQRICADCEPDFEQPLDYIEDLELRRRIFEEIYRISVRFPGLQKMNMAALGIVMVAPISQLQNFLRELQDLVRENKAFAINNSVSIFLNYSSGIFAYANRGGRQSRSVSQSPCPSVPATPTPHTQPHIRPHKRTSSGSIINPQQSDPPAVSQQLSSPRVDSPGYIHSPIKSSVVSSPKAGRNSGMSQLCKTRDHNKCIFTGTPDPEAAHIFPYGASKNEQLDQLKLLIRMFWGEEKSQMWLNAIEDSKVTDTPKNLLSLNHQIHWWFDNGRMALKPLRKLDDGSVVVQFHWLKQHKVRAKTCFGDGGIDITNYMQKLGLEDNTAWGDIYAHRHSGLPIETGQTFILKADKPELVPSYELLEISWTFLRIIAISGAAEPQDLPDHDQDADADIWYHNVFSLLQNFADDVEGNNKLKHDADSRG